MHVDYGRFRCLHTVGSGWPASLLVVQPLFSILGLGCEASSDGVAGKIERLAEPVDRGLAGRRTVTMCDRAADVEVPEEVRVRSQTD